MPHICMQCTVVGQIPLPRLFGNMCQVVTKTGGFRRHERDSPKDYPAPAQGQCVRTATTDSTARRTLLGDLQATATDGASRTIDWSSSARTRSVTGSDAAAVHHKANIVEVSGDSLNVGDIAGRGSEVILKKSGDTFESRCRQHSNSLFKAGRCGTVQHAPPLTVTGLQRRVDNRSTTLRAAIGAVGTDQYHCGVKRRGAMSLRDSFNVWTAGMVVS